MHRCCQYELSAIQNMQPRTITILIVLNDLKYAFLSLLRERRKNPALLNIYSFIDICAALANDGKSENRDIFETYLKEFCTTPWVAFSAYDLWAARCSIVHAFSPLGRHTAKPDGAKSIFYYSWTDRREEFERVVREKGYTDFLILDIDHVKHVAIDAFNSLHKLVAADEALESRFLKNAEHFLFDLQAFELEAELSLVQKNINMASGTE
jgi:hypothetical protein